LKEADLTAIQNAIYTEKYRPSSFDELVGDNTDSIVKYLSKPLEMPSFIFYSQHPGTGKTSTAKLIIKALGCDALVINSSDERGIDTVREKVSLFARSLSSNEKTKKCVFLDEADGMLKAAQDSLRNLMETYANNCFFVFSCNDVSKIIEPIRSRCVVLCFEKPSKADIYLRLEQICQKEGISSDSDTLLKLVDQKYPDIRSMVMELQTANLSGKKLEVSDKKFEEFFQAVKAENIEYIYRETYSGDFDVLAFNRWLFFTLFNYQKYYSLDKLREIAMLLADTEKSWNIGANIEVVFIANILQVGKLLK
jgi:replication factor C small subunit